MPSSPAGSPYERELIAGLSDCGVTERGAPVTPKRLRGLRSQGLLRSFTGQVTREDVLRAAHALALTGQGKKSRGAALVMAIHGWPISTDVVLTDVAELFGDPDAIMPREEQRVAESLDAAATLRRRLDKNPRRYPHDAEFDQSVTNSLSANAGHERLEVERESVHQQLAALTDGTPPWDAGLLVRALCPPDVTKEEFDQVSTILASGDLASSSVTATAREADLPQLLALTQALVVFLNRRGGFRPGQTRDRFLLETFHLAAYFYGRGQKKPADFGPVLEREMRVGLALNDMKSRRLR